MDLLSGLGFMSALQSVPTLRSEASVKEASGGSECLAPHGSGFHEPRPAGRLPARQDWPELLLQCACALEGKTHYREVKRANKLVRRIVYLPPAFMQVVQGFKVLSLRAEYVKKKGAHFVVEPPNSSVLWFYPPMEAVVLLYCSLSLVRSFFTATVPFLFLFRLGPTGLRPSSVAACSIFYVYECLPQRP